MLKKHVIAIIGPQGVGKTELHKRLIGEKVFSYSHETKTGIQIGPNKKHPNILYWDFGPDMKPEMINRYLGKVHKICLVFDARDTNWAKTVADYLTHNAIVIPNTTPLLTVGTQSDNLSPTEPKKLEKIINPNFFEVSSKTGKGIDDLYDSIVTGLPALKDDNIFFQRLVQELTSTPGQANHSPAGITDYDPNRTPESDNDESPVARNLFPSPRKEKASSSVSSSETSCSFALRLIGMALMLAAIVALIYLILAATGFISAIAFTHMTHSIVIMTGELLGVSAPLGSFSVACASSGLTSNATSGLIAGGMSLLSLGLGYGMFQSSQQESIGVSVRRNTGCC